MNANLAQRLRQTLLDMATPPRSLASSQLEAAFLADHCYRYSLHRRVAAILGFFADMAYIALDYVYAGGDPVFAPVLDPVVTNRILTGLLLLPFIALMYHPRFERDERFATRVLMVGVLVQFAFYCRGFLLAPYPYDGMYFFMGMFICLIFGFSMLRLRARPALLFMALALVMAVATFAISGQLKQDMLDSPSAQIYTGVATSFLVLLTIMSSVVNNLIERSERAAFARADELATTLRRMREAEETRLRAEADAAQQHSLREAAERRSREKSQFIAAAVHDLRQPIQAIGNALEPGRWALERMDLAGVQQMLDLATTAAKLMGDQLGDVLELSRLESGLIKVDLTDFDCLPVLQGVCMQLSDQARRYGVRVDLPSTPGPLMVRSDRNFFNRIVQNVLANGIKFRDTGKAERPWVVIKLAPGVEFLRIEVEDNGVGIAPELLRDGDIFKPFFQARRRRLDDEKGVGLGLSIVQTMLTLLPDHRLTVRSELGVGSCFAFEVPCSAVGDSSPARSVAMSDDSSRADGLLRGVRVLYVEDDDLVRMATVALLGSHGAECFEAASVADLERLLPQLGQAPNLILSDYRLPDGKTADDVIAAAERVFGQLPILIITGEPTIQERREPNRYHLHKPLSPRALVQALIELLGTPAPESEIRF